MEEINVLDDIKPVGDLGVIRKVALKMHSIAEEIALKEQQLAGLKEIHLRIQTKDLPDLMQAHQVTSIELEGGAKLSLEDFVSASVPAPSTIEQAKGEERDLLILRRDNALIWLRNNNAGDLIKNILAIHVPKGADKLADKIMAAAVKLKLTATRSDSVHSGTLKSFVKDQLKLGSNIPFDVFGISVGKRAVYELPKPPKERKSSK